MTDKRPAECRFRLQDEGKSYPRSSCKACGRHAFNGLGNHCHLADLSPSPEVVKELVEALRECTEWMEELRASGDAGLWDWKDDEYTRAVAILAKLGGGK